MIAFILKRLFYGGLVILLIVFLVTSIIYGGGVDPARMTFGQRTDEASIEAKRKELGLDKPWYMQQLSYVNDLSVVSIYDKARLGRNDFSYTSLFSLGEKQVVIKLPYLGKSYQQTRPVWTIIKEKLPQTVILAFTSITLASIIGIIAGIFAAVAKNKGYNGLDNATIVTTVLGFSLPSYVSAPLIGVVFGFYLHEYTGLNHQGVLFDDGGFDGLVVRWKNLLLPCIALGIRPVAVITQLTRSSILDVLSNDYIRTAKAKGLSYFVVLFKHTLKNALNPVLTAITGWFASLLAGAFFVEKAFDFDGLGQASIDALINFDVPVILGIVLLGSLFFVIINIIVDVLYTKLNPQSKL